MAVVIRILGRAIPGPSPEAGRYVRVYDPNGGGEHGNLTLTGTRLKAKRYADKAAALEAYRAINENHPLRPDGMPNRPLTAFTVELLEV